MDAQQFQDLMTALAAGLQNLIPAQQQAQGGAPAPKINVRIPTYKGAPEENVITWMLQCQNIFQAQGIANEQQRIYYAATGFEGAALHWYLNRVQVAQANNNADVFNDWTAFATALRTAFQPPNHQQYLRQQLKQLHQTGTVQEYGMAFRNLLGQIDDMAEADKIAYFVEGMKPATRMEVSYRSPATFEEAWTTAVKYDLAMYGVGKQSARRNEQQKPKSFSKSNSSQNRRPYIPAPMYTSDNRQTVPMELDQLDERKKQEMMKKGLCFKCGRSGHRARDCKVMKAKFNQIETEEPESSSSSAEFVRLEENREQLLRFNGKVNGKPAWILLDSGASRNFIDKKFVQENKLP